jgi:hypothetical protein
MRLCAVFRPTPREPVAELCVRPCGEEPERKVETPMTVNDSAILNGICLVALLGMIGCFLIVVVKTYQQEPILAVLFFVFNACWGIGSLIAFVYGWSYAAKWNTKPVMWVWSMCLAIVVLLVALSMAFDNHALIKEP